MEKNFYLTVSQLRELDRKAVEEFHISIETLMENAGEAAARFIVHRLRQTEIPPPWAAVIFCGGGHNGGDGLACARFLQSFNVNAEVILLKDETSLKGETLNQFQKLKKSKVSYSVLPDSKQINKSIQKASILVDSLLGTGFRVPVQESLRHVIEAMNQSEKPIAAVDIPSGLDADTGETIGPCVEAHETITFAAMKKGFLNTNSKKWTGKITVTNIGFPQALLDFFK